MEPNKDVIHRELGKHDAVIESLKEDITEIKSDLKDVKKYMIEKQANTKFALAVPAFLGTVFGAIGSFFVVVSKIGQAKGLN